MSLSESVGAIVCGRRLRYDPAGHVALLLLVGRRFRSLNEQSGLVARLQREPVTQLSGQQLELVGNARILPVLHIFCVVFYENT